MHDIQADNTRLRTSIVSDLMENCLYPIIKSTSQYNIVLKYDGTYFEQCLNIASKIDMIYA